MLKPTRYKANNLIPFSVRMTQDTFDKLNTVSRKEKWIPADIIRAALDSWFIEYEKNKEPEFAFNK